jgi:Domain of unknown function (DUF4167)
MRQGQQHRRGRNRNNRKGQNPLTRNFESSGPDVKIRGTPAHVAEKYMSLARDALSSGDPVLAENYLQHAEHYNRIILAFREQQGTQSPEAQNGGPRHREAFSGSEEGDDETGEEAAADDLGRVVQPGEPQPTVAGGEGSRGERGERGDGRRPQRGRPGNGQGQEGRGHRDSRRRERQRFGESDQQPDFLRRSVRRSRSEEADTEPDSVADGSPETAEVTTDQE